jgi:hypothetical protein
MKSQAAALENEVTGASALPQETQLSTQLMLKKARRLRKRLHHYSTSSFWANKWH